MRETITIRPDAKTGKPKLAMSRTEPQWYAQSAAPVAHGSVNAALATSYEVARLIVGSGPTLPAD
jgi:hypothetical protein